MCFQFDRLPFRAPPSRVAHVPSPRRHHLHNNRSANANTGWRVPFEALGAPPRSKEEEEEEEEEEEQEVPDSDAAAGAGPGSDALAVSSQARTARAKKNRRAVRIEPWLTPV